MNETRLFLAVAIGSGLETGMISPDDVIAKVTMDVLAHHLPTKLKAQLLTAALDSDTMGSELILDIIGVDALAEHAPMEVLWSCVAAAASRQLLAAPSPIPASRSSKSSLPPPGTSSVRKRKPNRSSRVRAGATSRAMAQNPVALPSIEDDEFDVVTRVGGEIDESDIAEELNLFRSQSGNDDLTQHGGKD